MRRQLLDALDAVPHARFLCYLVGPTDPSRSPGRPAGSGRTTDARGLLRTLRDRLRADPGVNAFLSVDADVDLDAVDAAHRSVRFARASNVVAVVAPGRGVDDRTASVLDAAAASDRLERVALVHEAEPGSTTTASLAGRRNVTVHTYGDLPELAFRLRAFVLSVMHREAHGDLPTPAW